jgi:hypothetical protein
MGTRFNEGKLAALAKLYLPDRVPILYPFLLRITPDSLFPFLCRLVFLLRL